jgi:hypothetical protein
MFSDFHVDPVSIILYQTEINNNPADTHSAECEGKY